LNKSNYFAHTKELKNTVYKIDLKEYFHFISDDAYVFKYLRERS